MRAGSRSRSLVALVVLLQMAARRATAWKTAVKKWHGANVAPLVARSPGGATFSDKQWWEQQYSIGKAPIEWFVSAEVAAAGAAKAVAARPGFEPASALHAGCGASSLGHAVSGCFPSVKTVVHADVSGSALAALEETAAAAEASGGGACGHAYVEWDACGGSLPAGGPGAYDLVLDKGALDAATFDADEGRLVGYVSSLREALAPGGLFLHWTDSPPEVRGELLKAAFPSKDGFKVGWGEEVDEDDHSDRVDRMSNGHAASPLFDWTYYRYTIARE